MSSILIFDGFRMAGVVNTDNLPITVQAVMCFWVGIHDIWFEQIGDLPDVVALEFFSIDIFVKLKVEI